MSELLGNEPSQLKKTSKKTKTSTKKTTTVKKTSSLGKVVKSPAKKTSKTTKKTTSSKTEVALKAPKTAKITRRTKTKAENTNSQPLKISNKSSKDPAKKRASREDKEKLAEALFEEKIITLPNSPSIRLREKAKIYRVWYDINSPKVMRRIAHLSGYLFVVSGTAFLVAAWAGTPTANSLLTAASVCIEDGACSLTESHEENSDDEAVSSVLEEPLVSFVTDFTEDLVEDTELIVEANNISALRLFIYSDSGEEIELPEERISDGMRYHFVIPANTLTEGSYITKVKVVALDEIKQYSYTGPDFSVTRPDDSIDDEIADADTTIATTTETTNDDENVATDQTVESSSENKILDDDTTNDSRADNEEVVESDQVNVNENDEEDDLVESDELEKEINQSDEFVLKSKNNSKTGQTILSIPDNNYRFVEIYAVPKLSTSPRFIGLANKVDSVWLYSPNFDTLPAGDYQLFASTLVETETVKSNFVAFKSNYRLDEESTGTTTVSDFTDPETAIVVEKVRKAMVDDNSETVAEDDNVSASTTTLLNNREVYYTEFSENNNTGTSSAVKTETKRLLDDNVSELNVLLKRYAVAVQSGDEKIIRLAKQQLNDYRNDLLTTASFEDRTKDILVQIDTELQTQFLALEERIYRFEKIISERTNELSTKDTDGDGISDFDESTIFNTDPSNTDTDNDGVLDGVEIAGGFDPLNSDQEAVINFHSPRDTKYASDDTLFIEAVNPVIETDSSYGVPVQAEIRGKALPNSYVTLFIFSKSTVVTIKTEDDGSFVYTFTKELEDGEHEVYVALTDNKGEIVAQSEPFRFIKTAEAFSPIDAEKVTPTPTVVTSESGLFTYNMVASMGVVTFGFILLMLGKTLRSRKEEDEDVNKVSN